MGVLGAALHGGSGGDLRTLFVLQVLESCSAGS